MDLFVAMEAPFFFCFAIGTMDFECMKKVIDDRNSTRVFNGKKIEEGVLEEILGYSLVIGQSKRVLCVALPLVDEYTALQGDCRSRPGEEGGTVALHGVGE